MSLKTANTALSKPPAARVSARAGDINKGVPLSQLTVREAADLGDGFMLIKVDTNDDGPSGRGARASILLKDLPTISDVHIREVLGHRLGRFPNENTAFMAGFRQQEQARRGDLESAAELIDSGRLASEMKVKRQSISKAVQQKRIFSLDGAAGKRLYPAFFAAPHLDRKQVQRVSRALGDLPGPSKWQFFTTPKVSLGGKTAIEALAQGEFESVLVAAAGFLES